MWLAIKRTNLELGRRQPHPHRESRPGPCHDSAPSGLKASRQNGVGGSPSPHQLTNTDQRRRDRGNPTPSHPRRAAHLREIKRRRRQSSREAWRRLGYRAAASRGVTCVTERGALRRGGLSRDGCGRADPVPQVACRDDGLLAQRAVAARVGLPRLRRRQVAAALALRAGGVGKSRAAACAPASRRAL